MPSPLAALSPLDGRYARTVDPLRGYFSEQALIRYRVRVELAWLEALAAERSIKELKPFSAQTKAAFEKLVAGFSEADAGKIKDIEAETNHDVKAIEYWLKGKLGENAEAQRSLEFIHFACTSEDINNLAYALMVRESRDAVIELFPGHRAALVPDRWGIRHLMGMPGKLGDQGVRASRRECGIERRVVQRVRHGSAPPSDRLSNGGKP